MELFKSILMPLLSAGLAFFAARYFWNRTRTVKTEDDKESANRHENRELAKDLATLTRDTADRLLQDQKERTSAILARLDAVEHMVTELQTKVSPLWAAVQSRIITDLTHPHPQFAEMDDLLTKLDALELTAKESARLNVLLEKRITSNDPAVSDEEKESAKLMRGVMAKAISERARYEEANLEDIVTILPQQEK